MTRALSSLPVFVTSPTTNNNNNNTSSCSYASNSGTQQVKGQDGLRMLATDRSVDRGSSPQQLTSPFSSPSHRRASTSAGAGGTGGGGTGGRRASTGMILGGLGGGAPLEERGVKGSDKSFPFAAADHKLSHDATSGMEENVATATELAEADDFVLIEQSGMHPWQVLEGDKSQVKSSSRNLYSPSQKTFASSGIPHKDEKIWRGDNITGTSSVSSSQDSDFLQFSGVAQAVSYVVNIVAAVTSAGDGLVQDALYRRHRLHAQTRRGGGEVLGIDDDSVQSESSGGGSVSRQRGSSVDSLNSISERFCPALSVYLHAVGLLHDIMQRTSATAKVIHKESVLQGQLGTLLEVRLGRRGVHVSL